MKIGEYEPRTEKKGKEEASIEGMAEGQIFWTVQTDRDTFFDVKTQSEAEIIARLVRIENILKSMRKT